MIDFCDDCRIRYLKFYKGLDCSKSRILCVHKIKNLHKKSNDIVYKDGDDMGNIGFDRNCDSEGTIDNSSTFNTLSNGKSN